MSESINRSTRLFLKSFTAGAAVLAAGCASTDPNRIPEDGFEYQTLPTPWPNQSGGKIEVVEFFWYGCPYCNAMEPVLKAWMSRQAPDVVLRQVHPGMSAGWRMHQQMYFTLEVMGKVEALHDRIYEALHMQMADLGKRDLIVDFVARNGVDRAQFLATFDSPEVRTRMAKANEMAKAFKLDGVPLFGVAGKYTTDTSMAGSREGALRVMDYLIARERGTARKGS